MKTSEINAAIRIHISTGHAERCPPPREVRGRLDFLLGDPLSELNTFWVATINNYATTRTGIVC